MSERGSSAALYRQKSREYIPTTLALSAARFSVTTLQRLPGGLDELEALAEQLPPEDRACTGNWHLLGEARGYAAARTALVTPGRARSGRRLPEAD
jgi:hypothetical protein